MRSRASEAQRTDFSESQSGKLAIICMTNTSTGQFTVGTDMYTYKTKVSLLWCSNTQKELTILADAHCGTKLLIPAKNKFT